MATQTSPLVRFWNLINQYKKQIRLIYYFAIVSGLVNLSLPLGIQAIINYLQTGELTTSWVVLVVVVLIGISLSGIIQINQLKIVEDIQQEIFARSAFEFAFRIPKIKQLQLDKVHAPELINRFFDVLTIQKGLPKILIDFSLAVFQIVFGLTLLAFYSAYFIFLGASLFIILYIIYKLTGEKGLETSIKESKYKYSLAHWLEEIASNTKSFKIYNQGNLHLNKTDDINVNYLKSRQKHFKVLIKQFIFFIGFKVWVAAALLVLGGYLVFNQQMNVGQFVASEIVIISIINSIEKIITTIETIYDVLTALDKIGYVTDLEIDTESGVGSLDTDKGIEIEGCHINFKYSNNENNLFDDLSFKIESGKKVHLTGSSGKGKSTLLFILARIHALDKGHILINGRPSTYFSHESFNKHIGFINPMTSLFEGTIEENILMNRDIENSNLDEILEVLNLNNYISKLKLGMKTMVDSQGRRMPRSIIQKIILCRTLIGNPQLLLLEDPLQFINQEEKNVIIDYIMNPKKTWTVVVIADHQYWTKKSNQTINL